MRTCSAAVVLILLTTSADGLADEPATLTHGGDSRDVILRCDFESADWWRAWGEKRQPVNTRRIDGEHVLGKRGHSLEVTVPAGEHLGTSFAYRFRERLGSEPEEIYFRYYVKFDLDWKYATSDGKMLGISGTYGRAGWGGRKVNGSDGWSARGLFKTRKGADETALGFYCYHADMRGRYGEHWQFTPPLMHDRWYCVEQFCKLNTPGAEGERGKPDGILRGWIDGQPAFEKTDIRFRDVGSLKIEEVWCNVYHGGATAVPERDIHVYLDEMVISRRPIGPLALATLNDNVSRLRFNIAGPDGKPLPCRVHLYNERGEPQRVAGLPFWRDHFVCDGDVDAELPAGRYRYEIERGPEYERQSGEVETAAGKTVALNVAVKRIANLRQAGWYSGDLHVHRPLDDIELLMAAEDLDYAPVITWWNNRNLWSDRPIPQRLTQSFDGHRLYNVMAGEDEREGGALLYFGLDRPLDLAGSKREVPSPMFFVEEARGRNKNVWIDIEKPFWWDVPEWLASGNMNSIGLANNHMCRSTMLANEAWGKPRDTKRLPNPRGNGFWTQEIYYHILNSGLRVPPSAGSASGVLPNPVGYNRVYVHLDKPFNREAWFEALARGRSFVTNGPLLLVQANGELPGAIFKSEDGKSLAVDLKIELTSIDRIPRLELVHNGQVVKTIDCSDEPTQEYTVKLALEEPGWFLVRAIADVKYTFRFASTAPWYIATDPAKRRISRRSAQFFLDWIDERIERVKANVTEEAELQAVLLWHNRARTFWAQRVEMATAD
jgi:hypothetical protein